MKKILEFIDIKQQEFAQVPLMKFLEDKTIDPSQRLAFAPCVAPFAMNFGDLNKYILREEPAKNEIQKIVNQHTYEDENHWMWFLEDLVTLNLDPSQKFSDSLRFMWGEETKKTRACCNTLIAICISQVEPIQKLVIVEAIEATGNVILSRTAQVAKELQQITQKQYHYFGEHHFAVETGHTRGEFNIEPFLETLELNQQQTQESLELVKAVFKAFTEATEEMLEFALSRQIK
ncbi:hypothetical protein NIES4074_56620 [Cylindrospermum sp. NIES-4074]|nr:hypothetical protein NIES4074_56620 [Cylindrospermum sp. NIES-4074]